MDFLKLCFIFVALNAVFGREYNGEYSDLFTTDEIEIMTSQRVRKEIRQLTTEEWQRVVDAMWVMKSTSQTEGEALYGSKFMNYDQLVCQHTRTGTIDGNIGHAVASFIPFHRALHMEFELSLMAVDPDIESVPYWDFRKDIDDLENSVIFGEDYFGSITGDADDGYQVTDGKFAYWPVAMNRDYETCEGGEINNFGYQRSSYGVNDQPHVVRYGTHHCMYQDGDYTLARHLYYSCLESVTSGDLTEFLRCWDGQTHAYAHHFIGGTMFLYDGQTDDDTCEDWFSSFQTDLPTCTACPSCDYQVDEVEDCFCYPIDEDSLSDFEIESCALTTVNKTIAQKFGDFEDLSASPNDPIFFFHHMNIDRYFFTWQLMNRDQESNYYNHPTEGEIMGVNLDDVVGFQYPFTALWDDSNKSYTNRDVWDLSLWGVNTYQYDTIIEMVTTQVDDNTRDNTDDDTDIDRDSVAPSNAILRSVSKAEVMSEVMRIKTTLLIAFSLAFVCTTLLISYWFCYRNNEYLQIKSMIDDISSQERSYQTFN